MIKHQRKLIFLFLIIFAFAPLFSYAFMTLNTTNNLHDISLEDNSSEDGTSSEEALTNLELESTNADLKEAEVTNSSDNTNDSQEEVVPQLLNIPATLKEDTNSDMDKINLKKENKEETQAQLFKTNSRLHEDVKKEDEDNNNTKQLRKAIPSLFKNTKELSTSTQKKIKEKTQKKVNKRLTKVLSLGDIMKAIHSNSHSTSSEKIDEKIKEAMKAYGETEKIVQIVDASSSLEKIEERERKMQQKIQKALEKAEREKAFNAYKKYYLKKIDFRLSYYYNFNEIYEDRGDKLMIAFSFLKANQEVHPMVPIVMGMFNQYIKNNSVVAKSYVERILELRQELENEEMPYSTSASINFKMEKIYKKALREIRNLGAVNYYDEEWIRNMKIVIAEFDDEEPFDSGFLLDMGCAFYRSYVNSLPPEAYHYCNEKNRFKTTDL